MSEPYPCYCLPGAPRCDDPYTWCDRPDDRREGPWTCICGSGDEGEFHSLMCVASNTPDDVWWS